ncbi:hypothetical protein V6590_08130 [Gemmobacter sp. JM10B15]|uniref:Uncharacterized protein n=1 Tax=Gemmobacter denitrificans TaxID=3123040 RepID=A0ABU8BV33_9RHOB
MLVFKQGDAAKYGLFGWNPKKLMGALRAGDLQRNAIHGQAIGGDDLRLDQPGRGIGAKDRAPIGKFAFCCLADVFGGCCGRQNLRVRIGLRDHIQPEIEIGIACADIDRGQGFACGADTVKQHLCIIPFELRIDQKHFGRAFDKGGGDRKHAIRPRIVRGQRQVGRMGRGGQQQARKACDKDRFHVAPSVSSHE